LSSSHKFKDQVILYQMILCQSWNPKSIFCIHYDLSLWRQWLDVGEFVFYFIVSDDWWFL